MKEQILKLISTAIDGEVTPQTELNDLDSLEFMELIRDLESEFHVRIADKEIVGLSTAGDVLRLMESKVFAPVTENAKHGLPA